MSHHDDEVWVLLVEGAQDFNIGEGASSDELFLRHGSELNRLHDHIGEVVIESFENLFDFCIAFFREALTYIFPHYIDSIFHDVAQEPSHEAGQNVKNAQRKPGDEIEKKYDDAHKLFAKLWRLPCEWTPSVLDLNTTMLQRLEIINYALNDRTEVDLKEGFVVITGETGAGKSILLEALNLVLGSRANFNSIRKGQDKCSVEALFLYEDTRIDDLLKREGLDVMEDLILRRELTSNGRSRAFINDSPVNATLLRDVSAFLIDVHGQQENLALQTSPYQLHQLDLYATNLEVVEAYFQVVSISESLAKAARAIEGCCCAGKKG